MAEYIVFIYQDEAAADAAGPGQWEQMMKEHAVFGEANHGAIRGGNALSGTATATSLRPDGAGGFTVTDGAFAETKEAIGGYYLIEAADLDEAMAIAKQVPAPFGGVEIRPVINVG